MAAQRQARTKAPTSIDGVSSDEIRRHYRANERRYAALHDEVVFALTTVLAENNVKTHTITGRVKDVDHFLEKIDRKQYDRPFEQTEDLVGVRVVALFLSDLPKIERVLRGLFEVVSKEDHIEGQPVQSFGYMSIHYVCRLHADNKGPRYDHLKDLVFEVQIRTIVMDAWANVSHYLAYRGEASIPSELRRDFFALSGLFYVADQHFEMLTRAAAESQVSAEAVIDASADEGALDLNLESGLALLHAKYPDRQHSSRRAVSEFIEEATRHGYKTVEQLDAALTEGERGALLYEEMYPPHARKGAKYADVGIARAALAIADTAYADSRHNSHEYKPFR